jgi:hypothetical protein
MAQEVGRPKNVQLRPEYTALERVLQIRSIGSMCANFEKRLMDTRRADLPEALVILAGRFREAAEHCDALAKDQKNGG